MKDTIPFPVLYAHQTITALLPSALLSLPATTVHSAVFLSPHHIKLPLPIAVFHRPHTIVA